jgi:hypothetical protein
MNHAKSIYNQPMQTHACLLYLAPTALRTRTSGSILLRALAIVRGGCGSRISSTTNTWSASSYNTSISCSSTCCCSSYFCLPRILFCPILFQRNLENVLPGNDPDGSRHGNTAQTAGTGASKAGSETNGSHKALPIRIRHYQI